MNLKTYTAKSMPEALALVRRDFGKHAVVLHTRSYKEGGILGIGAKPRVEVTAGDGREIGRKRRKTQDRLRQSLVQRSRDGRSGSGLAAKTAAPVSKPVVHSNVPTPGDLPAGDLIRRTYAAAVAEQAARAEQDAQPVAMNTNTNEATQQNHASLPKVAAASQIAKSQQNHPTQASSSQASSPQANVKPVEPEQITAELRAMKQMVCKLVSEQRRQGVSPDKRETMPAKLLDQYLAMIEQEVAEELAQEIIDEVRDQLSVEQLEDEQACQRVVCQAMSQLLPTCSAGFGLGEVESRSSKQQPHTVCLVGPTGVGKTTTVAKLAATYKLKMKKKVGLITLDTYRIAAVEQLRTYAAIIGVDLKVVNQPDELRKAIDACQFEKCDVVLIDTAGRSPRDTKRVEELLVFLEAAQPDETHLVLSSTASQSVIMDTVERFANVKTDRLIFTKLDEAVSFGVIFNVARKINKRLSYVTTGQDVPNDIEIGEPTWLASLMMGAKRFDEEETKQDQIKQHPVKQDQMVDQGAASVSQPNSTRSVLKSKPILETVDRENTPSSGLRQDLASASGSTDALSHSD